MKMRVQAYEKEYRLADASLVRMRREAKATGNFFVEPEAKLIFCTRIPVSTRWLRSRGRSCTCSGSCSST